MKPNCEHEWEQYAEGSLKYYCPKCERTKNNCEHEWGELDSFGIIECRKCEKQTTKYLIKNGKCPECGNEVDINGCSVCCYPGITGEVSISIDRNVELVGMYEWDDESNGIILKEVSIVDEKNGIDIILNHKVELKHIGELPLEFLLDKLEIKRQEMYLKNIKRMSEGE